MSLADDLARLRAHSSALELDAEEHVVQGDNPLSTLLGTLLIMREARKSGLTGFSTTYARLREHAELLFYCRLSCELVPTPAVSKDDLHWTRTVAIVWMLACQPQPTLLPPPSAVVRCALPQDQMIDKAIRVVEAARNHVRTLTGRGA